MERRKKPRQNEEFTKKAYGLFDDFYSRTADMRRKWEENEEIYRTNHWRNRLEHPEEPQPVNPVLFSTIESMLADIMDSYPEAVILAEEEGDDGVSATLNEVVKFILKRRHYRSTFRKKVRQALIKGTSVQEVFWDTGLYGGLGDVNIRAWDIKHFLFDPSCEEIQDGRAVFKYGFFTREWVEGQYPFTKGALKEDNYSPYDGNGDEVMVMEYWYKEMTDGVEQVHLAIFCGRMLLYDSKQERPEGMYAHGKYPFIVEALFPLEGAPIGLSIVDILKNLQGYADKLDQIILKNALMSGKMRMLVNRNAEVEEDALADWNKEIVHANRIDDSSLRWMQPAPLNPYVVAHYNQKIEAIKEESGQTMFSRGEAGRGVTAATSILALQEAGNKRSRLIIEQLFDGFEGLVKMVIDTIAENYDEARYFRIRGEGRDETVMLSSQMLTRDYGDGMGYIEFDVSLEVQKQSPYRTAYQNELALQLLGAGIVTHAECLSMMTFPGKERILAQKEQAGMGMIDPTDPMGWR
ncbi:hypothetical protein LJC20_03725 [Eubacteriales bacterium OttesenSCG-928-M02]|nr:hypothetical protein [Eubacteriales bacterium OttesenSCG-928-M02]